MVRWKRYETLVGLKNLYMGKLDRLQILKSLINEMFKIAGHNVSFDDISNRKDDWYNQYTMTPEQNKEWVDWGRKFIKKNLRMTNFGAEREMAMINLNYGLKEEKK